LQSLKYVINILKTNWDLAQRKYEMKIRGRWMSVVIANMWKKLRKRHGPNQEAINRGILRRELTFLSLVKIDQNCKEGLKVIKPFLMENFKIIEFK
jgi:hypothetical protein